jgi:hypothetical protein
MNTADRGCHVVSVTDPYGRILGFLDRTRLMKQTENDPNFISTAITGYESWIYRYDLETK